MVVQELGLGWNGVVDEEHVDAEPAHAAEHCFQEIAQAENTQNITAEHGLSLGGRGAMEGAIIDWKVHDVGPRVTGALFVE